MNRHNTDQFWARILYPISNFLLKFNASANFFIYLACDKMFRQLMISKVSLLFRSSQNEPGQENETPLSRLEGQTLNKRINVHNFDTKNTEC